MKLTILTPVEVEAVAIRLEVAVRYEEKDMPNDFPFRKGDMWVPTVDIDTGKIRDWPQGREAELYMKVRDQGSYYLLDAQGVQLAAIENDYVPDCIPGEYGDYIEFDIAADGTVRQWKHHCDADEVQSSFFPNGRDE